MKKIWQEKMESAAQNFDAVVIGASFPSCTRSKSATDMFFPSTDCQAEWRLALLAIKI